MVWRRITPHIREVIDGHGEFVSRLPLAVGGLDLVSDSALARVNTAARRILGSGIDLFHRTDDASRGSHVTAGYRIEIATGGITVSASTSEAAVNALASIAQGILLSESSGVGKEDQSGEGLSIALPAASISDAPRSLWRGFMIDVARHFLPVSALQELLDIVWLYRLNRFHLHLTDDQGWRFPVSAYPELTITGAYRAGGTNGSTYGGAYTQEELEQFDRDAATLGVTVVPEIDLPGHASAAITAYPHLGCTGEPPGVQQRWGIFHNVICASSSHTRTFLEALYSAVAATFSGPYIHIGGDEVPEEAWRRCAGCRNLDDPYRKIMKTMAEIVLGRGERPVAWDEAAHLDLPKETIIINWRRPADAAAALARGYDIVLAPEQSSAYLDHKHRDTPHEPGRLGVCTVTDSASFAPLSYVATYVAGEGAPGANRDGGEMTDRVDSEAGGNVLGGQANLWTEEVPYLRYVEYMTHLRLAVFADGLWSGSPLTARASWRSDVEALRRALFAKGYNLYPGRFE